MQPLSTPLRRGGALGLLLALATAAAACSDAASTAAAALRLRLLAPDSALHVGRQFRLTLDAEDRLVDAKSTQWSSSDPAVASVSPAGVVAALARGTTTIRAEYQGASAEAPLTVVQPVANVLVNPTAVVLRRGLSRQVAATPRDEIGTTLGDRPVTWSSSNPGVVTVSSSGVLTAVAPGTATISAASEGQEGSAQVTVTPVPLASLSFPSAVVYVRVGESVTFAPVALDSVGAVTDITSRGPQWTSAAPAVASVSAGGVVLGRALGDATISVTAEGRTATTVARVVPNGDATPSVTPAGVQLQIGQTAQLTAALRDAAGNVIPGATWTWVASHPFIATVSSTGLVTAVSPGTMTVGATSQGKSASSVITVLPVPVASVSITPNGASIQQGRTVQLAATPRDAAGNALTGRVCAWGTSSAAVASVSGSGLVTGVSVGSASVTATCDGRSGAVTVSVTPIPVATVSVALAAASVTAGQTTQATATTRDSSGAVLTGRAVSWSSGSTAIATVSSGGVVTAVAAGSTTITATSEGRSGSATLTVTAVTPPAAVLTTVVVTPDSSGVQVGQTAQLSAVARDQNGQPMTASFSWSSLDVAAATVNGSGLVTGVASGTARIVASSGGRADTARVVVTATAPPPPPPPAGSFFTEGFESNSFATWDDGYDAARHQIVTTGGAHTGNNFLRITYPAGNSEGGGWLTKMFNAGYDSVHFIYWIRFPSNWQGGSYQFGLYGSPVSSPWSAYGQAGVCPNGTNFTNHFLFVDGSGNPGPYTFYTYHMDMQGGCYGDEGAGRATYGTGRAVSRGVWHRVELQVRLNTPGSADGWERMYIDGVMQGEWRNLRQRSTTNLKITSLQITANLSGGYSGLRTLDIDDVNVATLGATSGTGGGGGTPTPAPVATVSVSPASTSVQAGSTAQLSATTRDASGLLLTGRAVTWSSSNTAVATVNGSGVVTGVAAGSATITATSESRTGTSAVTVTAAPPPPPPPPPGTTGFLNEPAGFTLYTDNGWDALGSGGWAHANRDSRAQVTADATAPLSASNVLEMLYPQGYTGGGEPAIEEYQFRTNPTEVFVGAWVKFSPNWQGHTSGINKIMNVMTNAGFGRTWLVLRAVGERDTNGSLRDGPYFVDVAYCGQYGGNPGANRSTTPFTTGVWHKVEWQIRTGSGGLVRWWVDGVLTGEYTNLSCMGSQLQWVEIAPTFGGLGDTKAQNDYIRYDHVRVSGR